MYACAPRGDETQGFVGGNEEIVKILVEKGADVNVKDNEDRTAYMYACGGKSVPIKDTLVDKGADTNAVDVNERTAKDYTNVGPGGAKKWLDLD
jgi:ankyrin repeat protein